MGFAQSRFPTPVAVAGVCCAAVALLATVIPTTTDVDDSATVPPDGSQAAAVVYLEDEFGLTTSEATAALTNQAASLQAAARLRATQGSAIVQTRIDTATGNLVVSAAEPAVAAAVENEGFVVELLDPVPGLDEAIQSAGDALTALGIERFLLTTTPELDGIVATHSTDLGTDLLAAAEAALASIDVPVSMVRGELPEGFVRPGDELALDEFSRLATCTYGFLLRDDAGNYFQTTATHCMGTNDEVGDEVYNFTVDFDDLEATDGGLSNTLRGHYHFLVPESDQVLVDLVDTEAGLIDNTVPLDGESIPITGFTEPMVGMTVCSVGMTSHPEGACGEIREANFDLSLPTGLGEAFQFNIQAEPGDSGGPVFTPDGLAVGSIQGGIDGVGDEPVTYGVPISAAIDAGFTIASEQVRTVHLTKRATNFGIDGGREGANGQNVYIWDADTGNTNQLWHQIPRGDGYYSFQKAGTTFCLDGNRDGENGQSVYLWDCSGDNWNQQWKVVDIPGGHVRLEKRNAPTFSIDAGRLGANGQDVYLWDTDDGSNVNQHFTITVID